MVVDKKVVQDVSGWLRVFDDGSADRSWTGPPEAKFMADAVPPHENFVDGVATRDVTVDSDSGLRVRIYLPESCGSSGGEVSKLPILLHFHGGGFCISQADWYMYYETYSRVVKSARAICVSVYLRRAPEHRLPAACDDGFSALLWLRSVARREAHEQWLSRCADFTRIFLIGDSSGGNVVHDVAARAGRVELSPARLAGAIPIHPGFCRPERSRSELEMPESPFLTLDMVDNFLALALPVGSDKNHPITCPMGHLAPPLEGLNLPPILLCLADKDLMKDTEMEYYEGLKAAKKDVELFTNFGVGHSFYLNLIAVKKDPNTGAQTAALINAITQFVENHK